MTLRTLLLPLFAILPASAAPQTVHVEEARFVAPPGAGIPHPGISVGWSAGRTAVGDPRASAPGRVYTYTASAGLWQHDATAEALDGTPNDRLGWSLDLDGDTLLAGAPNSGNVSGGGTGTGAAYVFARTGATWTQLQKFTPSAPISQGLFGEAVALDGDTLAIGHPQAMTSNVGEVDVYVRVGSVWIFQQKLVPAGLVGAARAGSSLALQGNRLVIGAPNHAQGSALFVGRAALFERSGSTWSEVEAFDSPAPIPSGVFGTSVALDGGRIAVGAIGEPITNGVWGRVHTFTGSGANWTFEQTLIGSDTSQQNVAFGTSLDLQGTRLLVGAPGRNIPVSGGPGAGALMLFEHSGSAWNETAVLWGSQTANPDRFGVSCALAGELALGGSGLGSDAYLFRLNPPTPWVYCTAKTASAGCVPAIGWSGTPSASSANPFLITAAQIVSQKFGILIYGSLYNQTPFLGGTLCIGSPVKRTDLQTSGGSPSGSDCTGSFAFDFNAHVDSGEDPALVAGVWVWSQYWYRDPLASSGTGLSNALRFRILP
jgi:hypothetical protein